MSAPRAIRRGVTAVLTLALASCSHVRRALATMTTVIDSSGRYPVVTVTGEPPVWRLDSLGVILDSGRIGFTRIRDVVLDPAGGVLVLKSDPPAIVDYDDHGHFVRVIGRVGSGPQEYRAPTAAGWLGDDLAVYDPANARLVRWDRAGKWLAQWSIQPVSGDIPMYPAGNSHVWLMQLPHAQGRTFVRFPPTAHDDTITPPWSYVPTGHLECPWGKGNIELFDIPFGTKAFAVLPLPDARVAELNGTADRIVIGSASGDTVRLLEHRLPPVPISDGEWGDSTAEFRAFMAQHSDATCHPDMRRPDSKVPVVDMEIDEKARLWVERRRAIGRVWDVWDGNRLVGAVPAPVRADWQPIDIRDDRMVVVRYHPSDGGWMAVVYRIVEQ